MTTKTVSLPIDLLDGQTYHVALNDSDLAWTLDRWGAQVPPGSWPQCATCGTNHHPADHA